MKDVIERSGHLLVFDKVNTNGHLFPKDCEIITRKTVPVRGLYSQIKSHKENDITVIDGALLQSVGTTLYPADDEYKMVIKEKENSND